jgi:transcription termination factor NusB
VAISELNNSKNIKYKIILNDYLEISKSFVNLKDTKIINAILDKFIK